MRCEEVQPLLSAYLDRELDEVQLKSVFEHLKTCSACSLELQQLNFVDGYLSKLTLPTKPPLVDLKPESIDSTSSYRSSKKTNFIRWRWIAFALAASVLIGLLRFVPTTDPSPSPLPLAATLVRSTGSVDVYNASNQAWQRIDAQKRLELRNGDRIRTMPSVACELKTVEDATLRMNKGCELHVVSKDELVCVSGEVWCRADESPVQVSVPAKIAFTCPPGECVVTDASDVASVSIESESDVTQQIWQLPLLSIGNEFDPELGDMLEQLLVGVGHSKARYVSEDQLRALGPAGAIPLLAYVASERSEQQPELRQQAARIGCELADAEAIDRLQSLKKDRDQVVAGYANRAIDRLR
jgi:hypothetical protein